MKKSFLTRKGFTLVEMTIGVAIIVFALSSGYLVVSTLARGETTVQLDARAVQKLHSTAEELRTISLTSFHTMTDEVAKDVKALSIDPVIHTTFHIDALDGVTRTRKVEIKSNYVDRGLAKEKTLTMYLAPIRGKYSGGEVLIKVVNAAETDPTKGIANVLVSIPGQETEKVLGKTGADGTLLLSGVQMVSGLAVHFDGSPVAYFHGATNVSNASGPTGQWANDVGLTEAVSPNHTVQLTVKMYPVGRIEGELLVMPDHSPVPLSNPPALITLSQKPGTLAINSSAELIASVGNNGAFAFTNVIPGYYSIHVIGNKEFAAVALPGDDSVAFRQTNTQFFQVLSNSVVKFNSTYENPLLTRRRGSFSVKVRGLEATVSGTDKVFAKAATTATPLPIDLIMIPTDASTNVYIKDRTKSYDSSFNQLDFKDTFPFNQFFKAPHQINSLKYLNEIVPDEKKLTFKLNKEETELAPFISPIMVNKTGLVGSNVNEHGRVLIRPDTYAPKPYVPVLATNDNKDCFSPYPQACLDSMRFFITMKGFSGANEETSWTGYMSAPLQPTNDPARLGWGPHFIFDIKTDQTNYINQKGSNYDNAFYLLHENALAQVSGKIINDNDPYWGAKAGDPFNPEAFDPSLGDLNDSGPYIQISKVYTWTNDKGYGGAITSNLPSHANMNFIIGDYPVTTDIHSFWNPTSSQHPQPGPPIINHTFSMTRSPCWDSWTGYNCLGLVPNLGSDVTKIFYEAGPQPSGAKKDFYIEFKAFDKVKESGQILLKEISVGDIDIDGLWLQTRPASNSAAVVSLPENISSGDVDLNRDGFTMTAYTGSWESPLPLAPGEVKTDVVIQVKPPKTIYSDYFIDVIDDDNTTGQDEFWAYRPPVGTPYYWYSYNDSVGHEQYEKHDADQKVQLYRKINVNIINGQVFNKDNATVGVSNVTIDLFDYKGKALATTRTNSQGIYHFDNIKVTPADPSNKDIRLRASAVGFAPSEDKPLPVYHDKECNVPDYSNFPCIDITPPPFIMEPRTDDAQHDL